MERGECFGALPFFEMSKKITKMVARHADILEMKPVVVNMQPKERDLPFLKGVVFRNKELECLKKAFPHSPRMWSVDQYWQDADIYVDLPAFDCDKEDCIVKKKVMEANGLEYRFE